MHRGIELDGREITAEAQAGLRRYAAACSSTGAAASASTLFGVVFAASTHVLPKRTRVTTDSPDDVLKT